MKLHKENEPIYLTYGFKPTINTLQAFRKYLSVESKFKMCLASNHDKIKLLTLGFAKYRSLATCSPILIRFHRQQPAIG